MKVVIDTNVLVSGLINPHGYPGRIIDLLQVEALQVVVDDRILAEYHNVLRRDAFRAYFSEQDREVILDYLDNNALHIASRFVVRCLPDLDDAPFLEVALSAEVPLVTGNANHYPLEKRGNCQVLSPKEFLHIHFSHPSA